MISKLSTKLSQLKMPMRSLLFSAALLPLLQACAHQPVETKFDGKWQSCEIVPQEPLMCLDEDAVGRLRKLLLQCGAK